uniref:Uncharacterized protein LOC109505330 n=1 Tax=Elaeis guineensis var. tenera TaxID=51953 RepID=A0A6J0PE38_ELAGV|nr:uncharacterized protein LOC109505330 [Elaeis guineensis]
MACLYSEEMRFCYPFIEFLSVTHIFIISYHPETLSVPTMHFTFSAGIYRLPVELGCAQSLMPLHSVTASALFTSMLSLKPGNWAWLSEDWCAKS